MPLLSRGRASRVGVAEEEPLRSASVACVALAGLVGVLLGYDMGVVSAALAPLQRHFRLNDAQAGLFVGFLSLSALPGCAAGSALADFAGRRAGIGLAAALFLLGNALMAMAGSYSMLLGGRAVAGFAMGLTYILAPLYVAEVSPSRLRGMLTSLLEVLTNVGILLGYVSGWACDALPQPWDWRVMLGLGVIPPLGILLGACFVMLESPRWLAAQGRLHDAEEVFRRVVGPGEAKAAIQALRLEAGAAGGGDATLWEVLSLPSLRWTAFAGIGVAFFSQATGCEAVIYYSGPILEQAGTRRRSMLLATVAIGCVKTLAVLGGGVLVDRWGRRPLLMLSSSGMCLAMAALAAAGQRQWPPGCEVAALCAFVLSFSVGFGPVVYVLNAEIYPQRCRSIGLALAMGTCRIMSAVVSTSFLPLSRWLSPSGALCLYSGVAALATCFVFATVPETRGATLETTGAAACGKASTIGAPAGSACDAPGPLEGLFSAQAYAA